MLRALSKHAPTLMGLLFIFSGGFKLLYPGEAAFAFESLELGHHSAKVTVIAVTVLELYLGVILVFKIDLKYGLGAAMGMMFAFTVFLWYLSTLANPPSCGCMGLTGLFNSNKQAALFGLFRNCVILWALKLSYDYYFTARKLAEAKAV